MMVVHYSFFGGLRNQTLRARRGAIAREWAQEQFAVDARRVEPDTARPAGSTAPDLRTLLACPVCYGSLTWSETEIRCLGCAHTYPIRDGIPVMLPNPASQDNPGPDREWDHKQKQAMFYAEEVVEEFEITRPHGTPRLYRWLLSEKFRRSAAEIEAILPGATALTVCGGSGMDAEFLVCAGAHVIASDLSLSAMRRTRERVRRYGLPITPLVADVERLPFRDRSIDLVYVHDGLHHLEEPHVGLTEMARVAARAVSVTEPAQAFATAVAVRLGLSVNVEEAGNRVARMTPDEVTTFLGASGFTTQHVERYVMYYKHEPGRIMRILSFRSLLGATQFAITLANALIGRWGNKLVVTAVRKSQRG